MQKQNIPIYFDDAERFIDDAEYRKKFQAGAQEQANEQPGTWTYRSRGPIGYSLEHRAYVTYFYFESDAG